MKSDSVKPSGKAAPKSGRFRSLPNYLEGGRHDACWKGPDSSSDLSEWRATEALTLEVAGKRACANLLGADVTSAVFPHARPTRSIRLFLKDGRSVIATRRNTSGRADLEFRTMKALLKHGAGIPKILGFDGAILLQEDLVDEASSSWPMNAVMRHADTTEAAMLVDAGLASLVQLHEAAKSAGLVRNLPVLGEDEAWRTALVMHANEISAFMGLPAPNLPVAELVQSLRIRKPSFVKWDARPPNAIVANGSDIAWIDWEHCGCRNSLDDIAWLLGDQTMPDWPQIEETLLASYVPMFDTHMSPAEAFEYLSVFGTFHMCYRMGKIIHRVQRDAAREIGPASSQNWQDIVRNGAISSSALNKARRTATRASRWASRSSPTVSMVPWLAEIAQMFDAVEKTAGGGDTPAPTTASTTSLTDQLPELGHSSVMVGANAYHTSTVICQEVILGALAKYSSTSSVGLAERFLQRFGGLQLLNADDGINQDIRHRLESSESVPLADMLLEAIRVVEGYLARTMSWLDPLSFAKAIKASDPSCVLFVWESRAPALSRRVAEVALS